jgi:uncharacterized protein
MTIDGLEFARRRESLSGSLLSDSLPRLAEVLFDAFGSLDYAVSGEIAGAAGKAFLTVHIEGALSLVCQRCLGPLPFALNVRSRMMLIESGAPWPEDDQAGGLDDETCDAIEVSRELNLTGLLEDEVLLALPLAPRHERCELPAAGVSLKKTSPFAQLARLKRG